jgi:hypothetical protein
LNDRHPSIRSVTTRCAGADRDGRTRSTRDRRCLEDQT